LGTGGGGVGVSTTGGTNISASTAGTNTEPPTKLPIDKLKICQYRAASITLHMQNIIKHANTHLSNFTSIATRVEAFATKNSQEPSDYVTLVAAVTSAQGLVTADIATLSTDASNFSCASSDPKGEVTQFRSDLSTLITDFGTFRTDLKNLIAGVKSAAPASTGGSN
ncbi:MAG: hypothetical protein ACHQUB_02055, partial [Candidatus Saccharimonadia bacterium]